MNNKRDLKDLPRDFYSNLVTLKERLEINFILKIILLAINIISDAKSR